MRYLLLIFAVLGLSLAALAQSADVRRLLDEAAHYEARMQWRAARRSYEAVLLRDRRNVDALRGLARIAMRQEDWSEATRRWGQVLDLLPNDLEAHYYRAIGYREIGVTRPPIARNLLPWRKAAREFQWVIARDSLFRDVFYQFALLRRYEGKYEEAIALGRKQLALKPEHVEVHLGLFDLYRYFIHHRSLTKVRAHDTRYGDAYSRFFLGEALREAGQLQEAETLFREVLREHPASFPVQPVWLALARVYYAQGKDEQGEQAFWQAVEAIRDRLGARLVLEDVQYVMSDEELARFEQLDEPEEWQAFFRELWLRRNPMPAAPYNVRLAEHYRRMLYAEKYFAYDGFRLWFNNPDKYGQLKFPRVYSLNHRFNDKGLVFIRHGPPDDRVFTLGEDVVSNESWRYYATDTQPELIFHFFIDRVGGAGNNWRLAPLPLEPRLIQDRIQWGRMYHRLLMAEDDLQRAALIQELVEEANTSIAVGLNTDRHTWAPGTRVLPLPIQVVGFYEDSLLTLKAYYALPLEPLREASPGGEALVDVGFSLYTMAWDSVYRRFQTLRLDVRDPERTMYVDGYTVRVRPDSYRVALFARSKDAPLVGGWNLVRGWERMKPEVLQMSDVVLAYRVRPRTDVDPDAPVFIRHGWFLTPNPTRTFTSDAPVWLYFEIYQLQPDAQGKTRYRLRYTLREKPKERKGVGKLLGLFSRKPRIILSLETTVDGTRTVAEEVAELDVRSAPPGAYELEVAVTDLHSGQSVLQRQDLRIRAPEE